MQIDNRRPNNPLAPKKRRSANDIDLFYTLPGSFDPARKAREWTQSGAESATGAEIKHEFPEHFDSEPRFLLYTSFAMKSTWALALFATAATAAEHVVNKATCAGTTYKYTGLAGYGFIPSNATDKYGDTIGGIGSSIAIEQSSWHKNAQGNYHGTVYALPDRGW